MGNQFDYRRRFPESSVLFKREIANLDDLFENAVFVLDANVLLAPFQIGKENLSKIKKVYDHLNQEKRIFIPEHAVLEFFSNRSNKISDLFTVIDKFLSEIPSLKDFNYPILEQLDAYSEISESRIQILNHIKTYKESLVKLKDGVTTWNWSDPVTLMYKEIFTEKNIVIINDKEDDLLAEYENRIKTGIPPGNRDNLKDANAIGDFLIWKSILKLGKELNQNVIFVSNDEKNDWVLKANKKSISTRYELVDEFYRHTNGNHFFTISYPEFLRKQGILLEEIESKFSSNLDLLETLIQSIYQFLNDFIDTSKDDIDQSFYFDPDEIKLYIEEFEEINSKIKSTGNHIDDQEIQIMFESLKRIKEVNYYIYFESHRMKHSTENESKELYSNIIKFNNAHDSYFSNNHF